MTTRINKYLAEKGYASRREADVLIEQKKVLTSTKKRLLIVGIEHEIKDFIFDFLFQQDFILHIAATNIPQWAHEYFDQENIIVSDVFNSQALLSDVQRYAKEKNIHFDGVGTFNEHVVVQTAELAEAMGNINIKPKAAKKSSANKFAMRTACVENDIPTPRFKLIKGFSEDELQKEIIGFGLPCIIKPVFGSDSYGVKKFDVGFTKKDISEVFTLLSPEVEEVFKNFDAQFLLEEYIEGPQFSVDGFIQNGKLSIAGMTDIILGPGRGFIDEVNFLPTFFNTKKQNEAFGFTKKVIEALEFNNCLFHAELRMSKDGPRLIEIACRMAGGRLPLGYKSANGYELIQNALDIWFGIETKLNKKVNNFVVQKAVFPRKGGVITDIQGIEKAEALEEVWEFKQISNVGDKIDFYPNITKPFYYYAATASSRAELDEVMSKVENSVIVKLQ